MAIIMRAAVLTGFDQPLEIQEVELKEPGPGQVLVETGAAGVCHSDLHIIQGEWPVLQPPMILGHEAAGIVKVVGPEVTSVELGQRVIPLWIPPCGQCRYCNDDQPNLCTKGATQEPTLKIGDRDVPPFVSVSAFAEHMLVNERGLVVIPADNDIPLEQAALVGCSVMTGVGAVRNTANVQSGDGVAIIGCGGVGLNVIQGCRLAHADPIIAIDVKPEKEELAREFGATIFVDASKGDPVAEVMSAVRGGVDYAFEVIGLPQTATQALAMVRRGGTAVIVGMPSQTVEVTFPMREFFGEKKVLGCYCGSADPRKDILDLLLLHKQDELKLDELVSRTIPLEQINEGFAALKAGEVARSVIVFDGNN